MSCAVSLQRGFWIGLTLLGGAAIPGRGALGQQTTGKIQGTVQNDAGEAVPKAQVIVVGTAFGAVTDEKGYYFLNNLPVGTYTLRAQFIGYAPTEQSGARVLGGQTITFNFKMLPSAVVVGGITVVAAANPIVPRDEVTSKSIVSGQLINSLPVDNARNVITLQAGVVESGNGLGVSIRGGRPGEANVYVDGAPVRQENDGSQGIDVQTNAIEEASVTTGAIPVQFGDAQSGIISFTTKSGGEHLTGALSAETDGLSGSSSVGYNRFEGSIGGPIPAISHLRFFLSGVLQGQSSPFRPLGAADVPTYTVSGIDTTVFVVDSQGTKRVPIPRFVQYSGFCDAAQNFGVACQGIRLPDAWSTSINLQGKVSYAYGSGSSLALSGLASGQQTRNWPATLIADPASYYGNHTWARSATLNWVHSLFKAADRALSLNLILSYGTNHTLRGILDPASELSTRNPTGGIELATLNFGGYGAFASDFLNNPDRIIRNLRSNEGEQAPLLLREELHFAQPYRMNPYGMAAGSWYTTGIPNFIGNTLSEEQRLYGAINVDWQANRYQRFSFGGEIKRSDAAYWSGGLITLDYSVYHNRPVNAAAWASDRLDLGDVVIDLGVRYDYYDSHALFPRHPGFTGYQDAYNWIQGADTNDAEYAQSLAQTFVAGVGHSVLSPRVGVSFPITDQTDFHLSYSHQVQAPDMNTLLSGGNGGDVDFGKTIQFEIGLRHAFNPDFVVDLTAYNKAKIADLSFRLESFPDPTNPGQNVLINALTNADFGYDRGVDLKFDRRVGSWLNIQLAYTFEVANGTGSNPLTYVNTNERSISGVTGTVLPPAEQPRAVDDQRTHNIVSAVSVTVPQGWQQGTVVGHVVDGMSAFMTLRVLSGLPYTPLTNVGGGAAAPGTNFGLTAASSSDVNSGFTPWTKYVDLRLNKRLRLGRFEVTAFADVRNLFNWKNIVGLFAETNDVTNGVFAHNTVAGEYVTLAFEAANNGALLGDGSVSLSSCGTWKGDGSVNCVELQRTEARFGNGDGVYTVAEQTNALNAYYNLFHGPYNFNDLPRSIRLGFELSF
jgi:outer membrane receptor protein involved in Fe transport